VVVGRCAYLALAVFGFAVGFADLTLLGPESVFVALGQAGIDPAVSVMVGLVLPLVLMTVTGARRSLNCRP
jgi:hypothetical protein